MSLGGLGGSSGVPRHKEARSCAKATCLQAFAHSLVDPAGWYWSPACRTSAWPLVLTSQRNSLPSLGFFQYFQSSSWPSRCTAAAWSPLLFPGLCQCCAVLCGLLLAVVRVQLKVRKATTRVAASVVIGFSYRIQNLAHLCTEQHRNDQCRTWEARR
jgi:hypothetical protein